MHNDVSVSEGKLAGGSTASRWPRGVHASVIQSLENPQQHMGKAPTQHPGSVSGGGLRRALRHSCPKSTYMRWHLPTLQGLKASLPRVKVNHSHLTESQTKAQHSLQGISHVTTLPGQSIMTRPEEENTSHQCSHVSKETWVQHTGAM